VGELDLALARKTAAEWTAHPVFHDVIPMCVQGLQTGLWDREYADAIGQMHALGPSRWPTEQVAAFAKIHRYLMTGAVSQVGVQVGMAPFPDAERDANAAVLCSLPPPFRAWLDMTQRGGPEDGWLSWTEPILANKSVGLPYYSSGTDHPRPLTLPRVIPPGGVPLEVGNSPPSRTALHMYEEFGVARWPYESTMITIFISSRYPRCMWDVPELADSLHSLMPRGARSWSGEISPPWPPRSLAAATGTLPTTTSRPVAPHRLHPERALR
jgi:hypothetical protein